MLSLARKFFKKLTEEWKRTFDQNICLEKLDESTEHAKESYEDVSVEREELTKNEIDKLKSEGGDLNLRSNLKVDFDLKTQSPDKPLLVVQSELDESLKEEEAHKCLYQQVYELLLEQQSVCNELGELPRPLLIDPLPTAEEIEEFRRHLQRLKEERVLRLHALSTSRREIKSYLQVLELQVDTEHEDRLLNHRYIKLNKETFARLQHMHKFYSYVNQIQQEIVSWWDKTLKSEQQRNRLWNYKSNCTNTEDLEMELKNLKLYYDNNKEIFELFAERKILWQRMNALEAKASEPGRYYNRGGPLLKEEKERNIVSIKLPKIEQRITELVKQYEEREHSHFLVYGQSILDVMANDWEKKRQDKEILSNERKHAQTPPSKSQLPGATTRTPMSFRNVATMLMHKTSHHINYQSTVSTSKEREINPPEKTFVIAKCSLSIPTSTAKRSPYRSPKKSPRIVSYARRRSGRHSSDTAKKRPLTKITKITANNAAAAPVVQSNVEKIDLQDTYDSFRKCLEPASLSSIKPHSFDNPKRLLTPPSVENLCPRICVHHTPQRT